MNTEGYVFPNCFRPFFVMMANRYGHAINDSPQDFPAYPSDECSSDDYDDYDDDEEEEEVELDDGHLYFLSEMMRRKLSFSQMAKCNDKHCESCVETADEMARELLQDEENEKLKKEKKRERKRKQRQKRKEKKENKENVNGATKRNEAAKTEKLDSLEEDGLDINSAFVSNAAEKVSNSKRTLLQKDNGNSSLGNNNRGKEHPVTVLAVDAFKCAREGKYQEAIKKYTDAISFSIEDFRLYVNRSLCFLQLREYEKALQDAIYCISYAPDYSKGFFRKGEAYLGLNQIHLAEEAFEHVLKLDPNCQEAINDLTFIRIQKLMDMGYTKNQASFALRYSKTINEAVEYILHNPDCGNESVSEGAEEDEIFNSNDEEDDEDDVSSVCDWSDASSMISSVTQSSVCTNSATIDPYTDVRNPYKCCDLYVGNILEPLKEKHLHKAFMKYGPLKDIRMLPSSKSAFLTYLNWDAARNAMKKLQGVQILPGTPPLIIKYPAAQLARLSGNSLQLGNRKPRSKVELGKHNGREENWCSQTMPPLSPAPSLSSIRSAYSQSEKPSSKMDPLKDPSNPTNCASIYVGNLDKKMKEKCLVDVFSRYGRIVSIRVIPESKCAFINFDSGRSAGNAMRGHQNKSLIPGTLPLIIKYPTKAIKAVPSKDSDEILDCYKWRTLGCPLGARCPNRHDPTKRGIALSHKSVCTTKKN